MSASTFEKNWDLWLPLPEIQLPEAATAVGPDETAVKLDLPDETVIRGECRLPTGMKARPPLSITLERPFATYHSSYGVEDGILHIERTLQTKARDVLGKDVAAYEAFRKAVGQDRSQEFPIEAWTNGSATAPETASDLHDRAFKLLEKGDARTAEEIFRRVTELEPQHLYAWNNLGRALQQQGKTAEALAAYEKAIEVNPFDEYAWANRGDVLVSKGQLEEAQRSFEKQIEVAPFRPGAYRSLGTLKERKGRFGEARELLERATSADPSYAPTWLQLAWVCFRDEHPEEGRTAATKAKELDTSPANQLAAAAIISQGPYAVEAGAWAEAALSELVVALDKLDPGKMGVAETRLATMLAEGWQLRGLASLETSQLERAERFLTAAWNWSFYPEAAVALARLRVKQGRTDEARRVLARGAAVSPRNPALEGLEKAVPDPAARGRLLEIGRTELLQARTHDLGGPPAGSLALDILLFVDIHGRVSRVTLAGTGTQQALATARSHLIGFDLGLSWPDGQSHPHVRRGVIGCSDASPCGLILDLPLVSSFA